MGIFWKVASCMQIVAFRVFPTILEGFGDSWERGACQSPLEWTKLLALFCPMRVWPSLSWVPCQHWGPSSTHAMQQFSPPNFWSLVAEVRQGSPCRWELMKFCREGCCGRWFLLCRLLWTNGFCHCCGICILIYSRFWLLPVDCFKLSMEL